MITTSTSTTLTDNKRLSLSVLPTSSSSSTLANRRRRNNKNLSLCLTTETAMNIEPSIKTASFIKPTLALNNNNDDLNAYKNGPVKIMSNLYLGSEKNANDLNLLKKLSINSILNVAAEVNNPYEYMFNSTDDMAITPSPSLSKASSVSSNASSIQTMNSFVDTPLTYQKLPWEHNQDNLVVELKKAIDIIDKARSSNQTILVHCQCGVARSATVIIAYVIKSLKLPMQEAYTHVKQLSPPISPNLGLLFQLREFEQSLVSQQQKEKTRPKSWMTPPTPTTMVEEKKTAITPNNSRFLFRASSLCLSNAWKRKLSKSTKSIFSNNESTEKDNEDNNKKNDGWWKTRKLSSTTDTSSPVCY